MSNIINVTKNKLTEDEKTELSILSLKGTKQPILEIFWVTQWKKLYNKLKYDTTYHLASDYVSYQSFNNFVKKNFSINEKIRNHRANEFSIYYEAKEDDDGIEMIYPMYELIEETKVIPTKIRKIKIEYKDSINKI